MKTTITALYGIGAAIILLISGLSLQILFDWTIGPIRVFAFVAGCLIIPVITFIVRYRSRP